MCFVPDIVVAGRPVRMGKAPFAATSLSIEQKFTCYVENRITEEARGRYVVDK